MKLVIRILNGDQGTREMVQWLLNDTCPQVVSGLLEAGKSELEKQGQPAVLALLSTWVPSGFLHPRILLPLRIRERKGLGRDREGVMIFVHFTEHH
jgi:hypothetical protein